MQDEGKNCLELWFGVDLEPQGQALNLRVYFLKSSLPCLVQQLTRPHELCGGILSKH